ncbi:MAG: hypothetical protein KIS61_12185 [Candidatus Eremiobacteraeota bacterium]|nr:hypothetical protein [Candidatus Eremiobacteraeota bacterium]
MHPLHLEGKWRIQAHGRSLVLPKRAHEKASHVWLKGFLWFLYLPLYPHALVEKEIGHRFKPDVVAFAESWHDYPAQLPLFWAEAGQVARQKLETLFRQFPATHFAVAKWGNAGPWADLLRKITRLERRRAPVDLLHFPADSLERFVSASGEITLTLDQVLVQRL